MREDVSTETAECFVGIEELRVALGTEFIVCAADAVADHLTAEITGLIVLLETCIACAFGALTPRRAELAIL